jgi:cyclic beta-1,2-glucan synthetase
MRQERAELMPWLAVMTTRPTLFSAGDCPESLRAAWAALVESLPADPRLDELDAAMQQARRRLEQVHLLLNQPGAAPAEPVSRALAWCAELAGALDAAQTLAQSTLRDLTHLAERAQTFVDGMDFTFLYDPTTDLFHIGCNVNTGELDKNHYDLLASEARLASLLAIGQNAAPVKHWLHMGRPVTRLADGQQALLSWSGTMFEYLLPSLLLRTYPDTLWQQTYASVIERQIGFGREHDIPWGVSESGFYTFDAALRYQYRAFGVPGVGLQRGLGDDLVVAPYASILALPFHPRAVLRNLEHFAQLKMIGRFGLYEAVDYTPERLTLGRHHAIVHSYMAHHQGMILVGIANYLHDKRMIERFHAASLIQSVDLLLQEQVPQNAPAQFPHAEEATVARAISPAGEVAPWQPPIDTPMPQVHYLSNGRLSTLITNAGAGFCTGPKAMLTRWRADTTLDEWGCWVYVQDIDSGALWSVGRQPVGERSAYEQVTFHPHMAEFRRRVDSISLHMEVFIAPDADVEIRRVTVVNDSDAPRRIGLVSYGEVVLAAAGDDRRHQAFTKLFVESSHHAELPALLYQRRARAADEERVVMLHRLVHGPVAAAEAWGRSVFSADRARFIGRTGSQRSPAALESGRLWREDWEGGAGATLDPIMTLGQEITLAPHTSAQVAFVTLLADSPTRALALAQRYDPWAAIERAQTLAQNQARHELRQLGFEGAIFQQASQLLSLCLYPHPALRAAAETLAANVLGQPALWGFGISGDYPIVLVQCSEESHLSLLQEMLQIHAFWRRRGIEVELVILNKHDTTYDQKLHNQLFRALHRLGSDAWLNQRGGVFLLRHDQLGEAERILLESAARVVLDGQRGALPDHLADLYRQPASLSRLAPVDTPRQRQAGAHPPAPGWLVRPDNLQFDNGLGGFTPDGKEYVIYLQPGESTPTPWINVIANPDFGFIASESGAGASWALNSGENRLTTWRNDPVTDTPSTILYLRDEESAEVWSPTPQPAPGPAPYLIRHGAGYTLYEHHSHALQQRLCLYTVPDAPVQILRLRLQNRAQTARHLTVTCYAEWVLGVDRATTQAFIVPEYHQMHGAIFARNPYHEEFGARVAFLTANKLPVGVTADRTAFLGRLGSLRSPQALERIGLNNQVQAGSDPCAVLQLSVDLPAAGAEDLFFVLGQGADQQEALALVERFRQAEAVDAAWGSSNARWEHLLGALKVETPDAAMDLLLNRWLLYQTISCRLWGRSALYQSSGAYGFRDQLQDVLALLHVAPHLARAQILHAASRQFAAGDVLHWWHPPSGRGVRTRIADDLLWLPYVTARYIAATGDLAILQEETPFLLAPELSPEEHDRYGEYRPGEATYPLLEHCRRALQRGLTSGPHGIPLIGAGDWNDGMNRVGIDGKGESIWLGWFAIATLTAFAGVCDAAQLPGGDDYRRQAEQVRQAVEAHGWDGGWYRRAYYDDGTPLGSAQNRECRIDAIPQSWGVLSGAADPQRARQAMDAVFEHLVKEPERLLLLFTPPLDKTPHDPGYIKGYLPGVRENGGQYTHAALWTIGAFAALGDAHRAHHLFQLINPILRSDTFVKAQQYKVEPYAISADVYNVAPHVGRGGWTWYTGSASWMLQVGIEAILGLRLAKDSLHLAPCLPPAWSGFTAKLRYGSSDYHIQVEKGTGAGEGERQVTLDGEPCRGDSIPLCDDGRRHHIVVRLHAAPLPSPRELSGAQ